MSRKTFHVVLTCAYGLAAAALAGCTTQQAQRGESGGGGKQATQSTLARSDTAPQRAATMDKKPAGGIMAFPTGNPRTSVLAISKNLPVEVRLNQPFEYELTIENLTGAVLHDVVVTDVPGAGLKLESMSGEAQVAEDGSMAWTIGDIAPKSTRVVSAGAVATREGDVKSCTSVSYTPQLCTTTTVVQPQLTLTKTGPAGGLKCDEIVYLYEVCNPGTGSLTGVVVTDELPEGLRTTDGDRTVRFEVARLGAGECETLESQMEAERTGTFRSAARATSRAGLTAESSPVQTVLRAPVLEITKTCPEQQYLGRSLTSRITVTNRGDGVAENVVVQDPLPRTARFAGASADGGVTRGRITWNIGVLRPGESRTVTADVNPTEIGAYGTTATVNADCAATATARCEAKIAGIPAILLEVVDLEDPVPVGDTVTYMITVTNQGTAPDTNVRITCEMEEAKELVSASGAPYRAVGQRVVFEPLPMLAPKARAEYRLVLRAIGDGDVRFKVILTSDRHERPIEETESTFLYR